MFTSTLVSLVALAGVGNGQGVEAVVGTVISPVYRSDDGGAVYVRRDGNNFVWFAEHPGKGYAQVYSGIVNGNTITGKYWSVPKGKATETGELSLRIDKAGQELVRTSSTGGFPFTRLAPIALDSFAAPKGKEAGFYSTSATDLDGAWDCSNGGRYYMRETDTHVVWFAERFGLYNNRPTWAQVFIGERLTPDVVRGVYFDLPKGPTKAKGNYEIWTRDGAYKLRDWKGSNPRTWTKDMVDFNKFAANIEREFKNKCVGFGYAIYSNGNMVKYGGGGNRLQKQDGGPFPMDHRTQKDAQSTSKSITAMAVMHGLLATGHDTVTRIESYLPGHWKLGKDAKLVTFRDLLQHKSGFKDVGDPDEIGNIKKTISNGVSLERGAFEYENVNFALFRVILPYLVDWKGMKAFEKSVKYDDKKINEECSGRFVQYAKKHLFSTTGSPLIQCDYTSNNFAYAYNFEKPTVKGYPQQKGQHLECGAGAWVLSAEQYGRILAAFDNARYFSKYTVQSMKDNRLGMYGNNGALGLYYSHGGSIGGNSGDSYGSGRGAQAIWMIYPNNVQAMVQVNSANNTYRDRETIMVDAFDRALLPR